MKELDDVIKLRGVGKNVTSTLKKKYGVCYVYLRSDGYYEVFKANVAQPETVFGVEYGEREVYPSNEDFGFSAFCTANEENAYTIFERLKNDTYGGC